MSEDKDYELEQTDELQSVHEKAMTRFNLAYDQQQEVRAAVKEDRIFVTVAGGMWDGDWTKNFVGKPMMEQDLISREIERIWGEYAQNRVTVNFRPADDATTDKDAELLDGMFRADMEDSDGQEATDNAINDALVGGFGAVRLKTEEAETDEIGEERAKICFEPIFDAEDSVWFDPNSKKADKSDAEWCILLTRMTPQAYEEEFGKSPSTFANPTLYTSYTWFGTDWVYVAKYYVKEEVRTELVTFVRPDDGETVEYDKDDVQDVLDDLLIKGFVEQSRRKVKRNRVHLYCLDGNGVLEDEGYIAGEHIPVVPMFGVRQIVNGVEQMRGIVRKAKDSQRLHNMQISLLADGAASGAKQRPILAPQQFKGLETHWANKDVSNSAFLPLNPLTDKAGNVISAGPLAYEQPPVIPPAMQALIQITAEGIQHITGASPSLEQVQGNVSAEAMDSASQRADTRSFNIADQARKFFKRIGIVYQSMAKEVYADKRQVRVVAPDGSDSVMTINDAVIDEQTGKEVVLNDLSRMKFNVAVDVGPSFVSQRDQTAKTLENIFIALPDGDPKKQVVLGMWIENLTASGVEDLKEANRKEMLLSGIVKPRNDEETQMIQQAMQAQANQPPDAQQQALTAMAMEAEAKAQKAQADTMKALAEVEKVRAETAKTLAEVDQKAMDNAAQLAEMIRSSQEEMLSRIAMMFQGMQQPQMMEVPNGDNPQV